MKLPSLVQRWVDAIVDPRIDARTAAALEEHRRQVPTLWLLGKAGAGKSSIVQRLTGDSRAAVGSGFAPCTRTARLYDHPHEQPVMRFLDTRGLGEPDYDPNEDLAACQSASHALLLVVRVDDPDQTVLLDALAALGGKIAGTPLLLIHTALHTVPDANARQRAQRFTADRIHRVLGRQAPQVAVDFTAPEDGIEPPTRGLEALHEALVDLVPALSEVLNQRVAGNQEQAMFLAQRRRVLGYAGAAGAIDLLPAVGLIAVPSIQGDMLRSLARAYEVSWNVRHAREFVATLGSSFMFRYGLSLAGRQLGKLIPVYGQTLGSAAAASVSFASTYALGRAACLYLHHRLHRHEVDAGALQRAFREAFQEQRSWAPAEHADPQTRSGAGWSP